MPTCVTHELIAILQAQLTAREQGLRTVLATVVRVDGSSYRKAGVRMLIREDGLTTGAVSGGCVEDEVVRQAMMVLEQGSPRMMRYDGRYRQGCDGILHVLLEVFAPDRPCSEALEQSFEARSSITLRSWYRPQEGEHPGMGTCLMLDGRQLRVGHGTVDEGLPLFEQLLGPVLRLLIFGGGHDAAALSALAAQLGWHVCVVLSPRDRRTAKDFPGAAEVLWSDGTGTEALPADDRTMAVVMTHNYARDLTCLLQLAEKGLAYVGLLGPVARRERLFADLMDRRMDLDPDFLESIHGPAGLDLGAVTPQEIALSIVSELLAYDRKRSGGAMRQVRPVGRALDQQT